MLVLPVAFSIRSSHSLHSEKKDPSPIRAGLYDEGSVSAHRKEFLESGPYRHAVIQDLCDPETLRQVREEIINNLDASFKETGALLRLASPYTPQLSLVMP